jgi:hypothetical protein
MANGHSDLTSVTYVALKKMQVDGTTRNIGDAVPEAAHWRNLSNYLASGYLQVVGLASGAHAGVPAGKAKRTRVGPPAGNAEFTHYGPVDPDGVPSRIPSDAP